MGLTIGRPTRPSLTTAGTALADLGTDADLTFRFGTEGDAILVSRSANGGLAWGGPIVAATLAAPLPMSLPAVFQHLRVLESCGLVASEKVGRVRTCRLELERLNVVQDWIAARRRTWQRRLDRLGDVLAAEAASPTTDTSQTEEGTR